MCPSGKAGSCRKVCRIVCIGHRGFRRCSQLPCSLSAVDDPRHGYADNVAHRIVPLIGWHFGSCWNSLPKLEQIRNKVTCPNGKKNEEAGRRLYASRRRLKRSRRLKTGPSLVRQNFHLATSCWLVRFVRRLDYCFSQRRLGRSCSSATAGFNEANRANLAPPFANPRKGSRLQFRNFSQNLTASSD